MDSQELPIDLPIQQSRFSRANWDTSSILTTNEFLQPEHQAAVEAKKDPAALRSQWVNETNCEGCSQAFGWVYIRPHHCRKCNGCFCWLCSIYSVSPDLINLNAQDLQRVCHKCYIALGGKGKINLDQCSLPTPLTTKIASQYPQIPLETREQEVLAELYYHILGPNFPFNAERAIDLFKLSAEAEHPEALCNLGLFYQHGKAGIPMDENQALVLFEKAAQKGSMDGKHNAGTIYYDRGDYATAAEYWQGVPPSRYNLGYLHLKGKGIPQDFEKARNLFLRVMTEGPESCQAPAAFQLGMIYQLGLGVEANIQTARTHFEISSKLGCIQANTELEKLKANCPA